MAARGNATSFLMPWQSILSELSKLEKLQERGKAADLPLSGEDLRSVVQVLLKCNDSTQKKNLPKFIHQATVRRSVVIRHFQDMKERGHRGYLHVNMEQVIAKATSTLPENGVPEIILRDLPFESDISKIMIQQAATPVAEPTADLNRVERLLSVTVPNAVTMKNSSRDTVDYNNMYHNAFEHVKIKFALLNTNNRDQNVFRRLSGKEHTVSKHAA